ncbi:hypothetical protein QQS21_010994 [Conoideocrella luteorostrata]|uniref:Uncharacterized protein n=1 Tax=Conoideocrella luteorostrata TaxID=1105319 RepID=A0AAJ0CE81_9HYPO|nr:hypothetical protein QQS21_010994 [Conoideocrella luteorostrata]
MFGTFKYKDNLDTQEHSSRPDHPSSTNNEEYARTACDLCRARKASRVPSLVCCVNAVQCNQIDRHGLTLIPSEAKMHSGVGPGKKRLRKVSSPSFNAALSQKLPRSSSLSPSLRHGHDHQSRSTSRRRGNEVDHLAGASLEKDDFLTGDGFILCPAKHMSAVAQPPLADDSAVPLSLAGKQISALDTDILEPFASAKARSEHVSAMNLGRPDISDMIDGTLMFDPSSAPWPASCCDCLSSMLQTLEELGSQTSENTTFSSTDTLFLCLEQGIERCTTMLSCATCDTYASNPMLVVIITNQLATVLAELVHRFIQCQSRESTPTVFQFGTYRVKQTAMRTRLLESMIMLHAKDLSQLIARLGDSMAGKSGRLLDDAENKVQGLQQTLSTWIITQNADRTT